MADSLTFMQEETGKTTAAEKVDSPAHMDQEAPVKEETRLAEEEMKAGDQLAREELAEKEKAEEQKKPKQEQEPSAEPQQEPPTTSANKMGRASCWTSHGDVSGYLKSGMLGFEQSTILEAQLKCTKLN